MRFRDSFRAAMTLGLAITCAAISAGETHAQKLADHLIVVSAKKLPAETQQPGIAMTLHWVGPQALYLYIEEADHQRLAVYDVTDPGKIKLKKVAQLEAAGAFDFVQAAAPSLELIRYRESGRLAVLDLSKPRNPYLCTLDKVTEKIYIAPREVTTGPSLRSSQTTDYDVITPSNSQPLFTAKDVLQEARDSANGTTYLLGTNGLTVIRDILAERRLAASAPGWTNTIDDN